MYFDPATDDKDSVTSVTRSNKDLTIVGTFNITKTELVRIEFAKTSCENV
jgi:hypothetical protein